MVPFPGVTAAELKLSEPLKNKDPKKKTELVKATWGEEKPDSDHYGISIIYNSETREVVSYSFKTFHPDGSITVDQYYNEGQGPLKYRYLRDEPAKK